MAKKELQSADAEYFAGFFDGDGMILHTSNSMRFRAYQTKEVGKPPELLKAKRYFGGAIRCLKKRAGARMPWVLDLTNNADVGPVLRTMSLHGIIKRPQADVGLDYMAHTMTGAECKFALTELKTGYRDVRIDQDRITLPYLAGLFAAEGCVGMYKHKKGFYAIEASISQESCPRLLEAITAKLGFGSISGGKVRMSHNKALEFLGLIRPHMKKSQKKKQVKLVLNHYRLRPTRWEHGQYRTEEDKRKTEEIAHQLKKLKKT